MSYTQKPIHHNSQLRTAKNPVSDQMLEHKLEAMIANEEPISGTAELIYTKKRDGVLPAYDPRTDKFDNAIEAINNITMAAIAKRKELSNLKTETETETPKPTAETEPAKTE